MDHQNGKTVCPLKVPKSGQCIRFFSCSLFYPHVSVSIIKIAFIYKYIYIYISLFNIRQLSIKTANEIHYCGTYTDPHYQPLPVQSSRYLLLSRNMPIIENEYFVAKNVRVLDESYLYFPCCKNHHTRLILLSSVFFVLVISIYR